MDIGSSTRAPVLPPFGESVRVGPAPPADGVRTDLPAFATVQRPAKPEAPTEERAATSPGDLIGRHLTVDIETQKIVFQAVDEQTGDIIMQLPDARSLKAYADQLRKAEADEPAATIVERIV